MTGSRLWGTDPLSLVAALEGRMTGCCAYRDDDDRFQTTDTMCGRCQLDLDVRAALLESRAAAPEPAAPDLTRGAPWPVTHSLERTSPIGGPFIGRCVLCGMTTLPAIAATWPCGNPKGVPADDALIGAVEERAPTVAGGDERLTREIAEHAAEMARREHRENLSALISHEIHDTEHANDDLCVIRLKSAKRLQSFVDDFRIPFHLPGGWLHVFEDAATPPATQPDADAPAAHDCESWREEGIGCSQCNPTAQGIMATAAAEGGSLPCAQCGDTAEAQFVCENCGNRVTQTTASTYGTTSIRALAGASMTSLSRFRPRLSM